MSALAESEYDIQLFRGIQTALRQARELGYHVESMDITASVLDGQCNVHLAPLPIQGCITCGGDLTVTIDAETGKLLHFQRGQ